MSYITPEMFAELRRWGDEVDAALDAERCPRCDAVVSCELNQYQGGESSVDGEWYIYHCGACGYVVHRKEARARC